MTKEYRLDRLPVYNSVEADEQYKKIMLLVRRFDTMRIVLMQSGRDPSDTQRNALNVCYDRYLFHKSSAVIFLFHSDYEAMDRAVLRANSALNDFGEIVRMIVSQQI